MAYIVRIHVAATYVVVIGDLRCYSIARIETPVLPQAKSCRRHGFIGHNYICHNYDSCPLASIKLLMRSSIRRMRACMVYRQ